MFVMVSVILAVSGAFLGAMSFTYATWPGMRRHPMPEPHLRGRRLWQRVVVTGIVSTIISLGLTSLFSSRLVDAERAPAPWRILVGAFAILFVYDILYYAMHRWLFHQWRWLQKVHAVHHQSHRPIPIHAMYLHPIENFMGLVLFLFTVWLLGPVHLYTFGVCFFIYSCLNIVTHVGLELPVPYLRLLSAKHDAHHKHMRAGNFATLSPIPDILFGTVEQPAPLKRAHAG